MKKLVAIFLILFIGVGTIVPTSFVNEPYGEGAVNVQYPDPKLPLEINPVAAYEGRANNDLEYTMVPIPMKDRVFNKTSIQCVWCSLETIGRYAEEPKLIGLTDLLDCKSYASPASASAKLKQLNVKFEQTTSKSDRSLIIKSVVKEKRGCLFAIPGHAMTLVHYDEQKNVVKYINNSDKTLQIRTWTIEEFNKHWDGWICAIYADNDIIPQKYTLPASTIPIIDRNNPQGEYKKDYVIQPNK
jgi:hypothetical protein